MSFNPPTSGVTDGAQYAYGNLVWEFSAASGVWNIVNGSVVGGQGPAGPAGPAGPEGPIGPTGNTGTPSVGSYTLTGVASFDPRFFGIGTSGHLVLTGAYQITGDTVQAGYGINIGTGKVINNTGVTAFNGLTGNVSLTGDGSALFGYANNQIGARLGSYTLTGVASFDPRYFGIGLTGHLVLTGAYQVTGDTVQAGYGINIGTGKVINNTGVTSFNGATGTITITGSQHGIPYINTAFSTVGGLTASSTLRFNGTSFTFGSATSVFTVTGPSIVFGATTQITGGVFTNPAEFSPHFTLGNGVNDVVVNGVSGSIQRYTIQPTGKVTIKTGAGWNSLASAVETVAVIIQNKTNITGSFDPSILTEGSTSPILFGSDTSSLTGATGGITMLTIMRVNKGGANGGLTMGFVISTGMTGANMSIS